MVSQPVNLCGLCGAKTLIRRGFAATREFSTAMQRAEAFCLTIQRNEMGLLLRDNHLGSALHRKTRGQKRKQKWEQILHLDLDDAAGRVGLARANPPVL